MKLFFIIGEDSGDALAAPLIESLKETHGDDLECVGVGGPRMQDVGFDELLPMDQISVMGIWEILPKIPRLLRINRAIIEEIEKQQPDAVITVDFPDFNFITAKKLKKRGIYTGKIIHYVAPSVWAWRPKRAEKIAQFLDGIMCLFPMEVEYFTKHDLKAAHVGHPLITSDARNADPESFRKENNIPSDAKTVGLFFGSREMEFKNLSSTLKEAARLVEEMEDNVHIIAPTLPHLEYEIQKILADFDFPVYVSANPTVKWEAFKACDVAIAVSGTVALELSYAGIPHVIAYKLNPVSALILRFLVKTKHAHLANILLDKEIVPECLQDKCKEEIIAQHLLDLLQDEAKHREQVESFEPLHEILGGDSSMSPSQKAAEFITNTINS
ncbi:MAG: lipid-A-disaccharide synthase [Alphaproteobacteria bacterium]